MLRFSNPPIEYGDHEAIVNVGFKGVFEFDIVLGECEVCEQTTSYAYNLIVNIALYKVNTLYNVS